MTQQEFVNKIWNFPTAQFCAMVYQKSEKLLKKSRITKVPCPFPTITKLTRMVVAVGKYSYSMGVNNRREKEGLEKDFQAQELPWGQWADGSNTIITHNGNLYLRGFTDYANSPITSKYLDDAQNVIPKEALSEYLPAESENKSQGLEFLNPVKVIAINIDNIKYFKTGTLEYGQFSESMKKILELE